MLPYIVYELPAVSELPLDYPGIHDRYNLPYDINPIAECYRKQAAVDYGSLLLRQRFGSFIVGANIFTKMYPMLIEDEGHALPGSVPIRGSDTTIVFHNWPQFNKYDKYILYLILKPGYYPEVVIYNRADQKEREWYDRSVTLLLWPEKQRESEVKPYYSDNINLLHLMNTVDYERKPLFRKYYLDEFK